MEKLRIKVFGNVQVQLGDQRIELSRQKALAVLVFLAVTGKSQSRESLATMLWPESTQSRALANLRQSIWEIRNSLGDYWLDVSRESLRLIQRDNLLVDIVEFHELLEKVKAHVHPEDMVCESCLANYFHAEELFSGNFLEGFSLRDSLDFDNWQYFQTIELNREIGGIYNQIVEWCSQKHDYDQAIGYARRWLQLDELNENVHRTLMRIYFAKGQRNRAIQQYQTCVDLLERQLDVTPEAITTELYRKIQSGSLEMVSEPTRASQSAAGSKLPKHITPFIGRMEEVTEIYKLLLNPDIRLLTILAPGGMGKSRLAIEIARKLEPHFEDGTIFIPFAQLESSEMFLSYFANAVGYIRTEGKPLNQQLAEFFLEKSMLLVLDNFEHLINMSDWVNDLLINSPNLKILTTSRVPLNINAETRFHLNGLNFPKEGTTEDLNAFSAVKLFLRATHRVRPLFIPTKDDLLFVGEICRLVGGMPLAIEMASSWMEMLSLPEIIKEIRSGLDLFETDIRDIPERQQNLYTVFDYSWKILNEKEREGFSQLSIFRGGFTREAAENVVGISLRQLVGFVNRSLLKRTPSDRFEIHELLRQYGFEKLQENPVCCQDLKIFFAEYFCNKMAVWHEDLKTGKQRQAMVEINADFENIQHAWEIALHFKRLDLINSAFGGLILYLIQRVRYDEAVALFELAVNNISDETREGARILSWLTGHLVLLHLTQGNIDQVKKKFKQSLDLMDRLEPIQNREEKCAQAFHYYVKGIHKDYLGDTNSFRTLCNQSIELFEEAGDDWWCEVIYREIGSTAWVTDSDLNKAYEYLQEAIKIAQKINDQFGLAVTLERLGWFSAYAKGELEKAESYLRESSRIYLELDDVNSYIRHLNCLEQIANINGRFQEVLELRQKRLQILEKLGDPAWISELYMLLGEAYHHIGDYDTAEIKGRKGFEYLNEKGSKFYQAWSRWFLGLTLFAKKDYEKAFNLISKAVEITRELGRNPHLVGYLAGLIRVEIARANHKSAERLLIEGLEEAITAGEPFMMLYILASAAMLLAVRGEADKALEVYSLVQSWNFVSNSIWFSDVYKQPLLSLIGPEEIVVKERQPKVILWQMAETLLIEAKQT
jgi:DNA-binding SARP family transcriptional activator